MFYAGKVSTIDSATEGRSYAKYYTEKVLVTACPEAADQKQLIEDSIYLCAKNWQQHEFSTKLPYPATLAQDTGTFADCIELAVVQHVLTCYGKLPTPPAPAIIKPKLAPTVEPSLKKTDTGVSRSDAAAPPGEGQKPAPKLPEKEITPSQMRIVNRSYIPGKNGLGTIGAIFFYPDYFRDLMPRPSGDQTGVVDTKGILKQRVLDIASRHIQAVLKNCCARTCSKLFINESSQTPSSVFDRDTCQVSSYFVVKWKNEPDKSGKGLTTSISSTFYSVSCPTQDRQRECVCSAEQMLNKPFFEDDKKCLDY